MICVKSDNLQSYTTRLHHSSENQEGCIRKESSSLFLENFGALFFAYSRILCTFAAENVFQHLGLTGFDSR